MAPQYAAGAQRYKARRSRATSRREHRLERASGKAGICTRAASIGPSALTLGADLISAPRSARCPRRLSGATSKGRRQRPQEAVAPLLTPDYTPYIPRIANMDCAVSGFAGANCAKFMRSYADHRLARKSRYSPGGPSWTMRYAVWAAKQAVSFLPIGSRRVRFVRQQALRGSHGDGPWCAARWLFGRHVHRGSMHKQPFSPRWQGRGPQSARRRFASGFLTDTPRGPVKFDHFGDVVGDVFVRKRDRKNGQLAKAVINYSNMSQFWTYDEKPFLTSPIRP
jgi:hypothetical protein